MRHVVGVAGRWRVVVLVIVGMHDWCLVSVVVMEVARVGMGVGVRAMGMRVVRVIRISPVVVGMGGPVRSVVMVSIVGREAALALRLGWGLDRGVALHWQVVPIGVVVSVVMVATRRRRVAVFMGRAYTIDTVYTVYTVVFGVILFEGSGLERSLLHRDFERGL